MLNGCIHYKYEGKTHFDFYKYQATVNMSTAIESVTHPEIEKEDHSIKKIETSIENTTSEDEAYNEKYHSRGVRRMEEVAICMDNTTKGKFIRISLCVILFVCSWVISLDSSTTTNYQPYATSSFSEHSLLSSLSIAVSIIYSVSRPLVAKIADITARPTTYFIVLIFYTVGYIITATSKTISAYIVGVSFVSFGQSGIDLLNNIISADITPLKYRGLMYGLLSSPYLINAWYAGVIADHFINTSWRWGYGMFAILVPAAILPAIAMLVYLEFYANRDKQPEEKKPKKSRKQILEILWRAVLEVDLFGLLLMSFGFALILIPLSLYSTATNEWKNPSLIAMFVVGGVLLILYTIYEFWFAPFPSMPKRVLLNRTFVVATIIDFFYMLTNYLRLLYFSSYDGVIKDWSTTNWTYFNNSLSLSLCLFAAVAGIAFRFTHHCKYFQIAGLAVQLIAMGLTLYARNDNSYTSALVFSQILNGAGGAFSTVGSMVAAQASVPHQDTALVIALLSQWSNIGAAIGSAIAGVIWETKLPDLLREYLPSDVDDETVLTLYSSYAYIQEYPMGTEIREGAMKAYYAVGYYLFKYSLALTVIPFVLAFFQKNYYLGDAHNAVEHPDGKIEEPKTKFGKFMKFLDDPLAFFVKENK